MLSLETVQQNQQDLTATMTARTVLPWFATATATACHPSHPHPPHRPQKTRSTTDHPPLKITSTFPSTQTLTALMPSTELTKTRNSSPKPDNCTCLKILERG